jgi:alanine dehydrogenase
MAVSQKTKRIVEQALADPAAAKELSDKLIQAKATAIAAITVTPTAGSLPTANGAVTIANTATPTVVELLEFCVELNAKVDALRAALTGAGVSA